MGSIAGWLVKIGIVAALMIGGLTILGSSLSGMFVSEAEGAECRFKFQCSSFRPSASTRDLRTSWESGRIKVGDLYRPRPGARVQIRNNARQILGYIERDGSITNTSRQELGRLDSGLEDMLD